MITRRKRKAEGGVKVTMHEGRQSRGKLLLRLGMLVPQRSRMHLQITFSMDLRMNSGLWNVIWDRHGDLRED